MGFIEALASYLDQAPICERIPILKDRLAVFTNYPSVTKDQVLEETVLTIHGCFQPVGVTIKDTIACHLTRHNVIKS